MSTDSNQPSPKAVELDPAFGEKGIAHPAFTDVNALMISNMITFTSSTGNKILCCAWAEVFFNKTQRYAIFQLNDDGTPDQNFGESDKGITYTAHDTDPATFWTDTIMRSSDGTIYVAGDREGKRVIAKFDATGHIDKNYGNDGLLTVPDASIPSNIAYAPVGKRRPRTGTSSEQNTENVSVTIAHHWGKVTRLQRDGKIVTIGSDAQPNVISRLMPDGSVDQSFGVSGHVILQDGDRDGQVHCIYLSPSQDDSEGMWVCGRYSNDKSFVARITEDGALNPAFGTNGFIEIDLDAINDPEFFAAWITGLHLRRDGSLVTTGFQQFFDKYPRAILLGKTANGANDAVFNNGTPLLITSFNGTEFNQTYPSPDDVVDASIYVGGTVVYSGFFHLALTRLIRDGTVDTDFGINGYFHDAKGSTVAMSRLPDGNILIAGYEDYKLPPDPGLRPVLIKYLNEA